MFTKQVTIFHAVMAADLEAIIKEGLNNIDMTNPTQVFTFLQKELTDAGGYSFFFPSLGAHSSHNGLKHFRIL